MSKYDRDITFPEYLHSAQQECPDYIHLVERLRDEEVGQDILQDLIQKTIERQQAYDLSLLAIDAAEGRKPLSDALDFMSNIHVIEEEANEDEFVTDDIEELYNETIHKKGLRWRLNTLNRSLGSLRKGDFGFIFARPETGKTTFLASEVTNFAEQTDKPILWFNNEEGGKKVKVRIVQASLGYNLTQLYSNRPRSQEVFIKNTKGNIKLKDSATITKRQIEKLCKEFDPALIVFDQIDKIKGFNADREDLRLGAIYIWARELAKQYCPVIGICQADVSGENKKYLTMENVANAKCLAPNTKVLMFNGKWKRVDSISVGEQVMGIDNTPRTVLSTTNGVEEMFSVSHKIGGDTYVVNKSHILALESQSGRKINKNILSYNQFDFGYRVSHNLPEAILPIDPYFLGAWLGDGGKDKAEITTIDPEIVEVVKEESSKWGCTYTQYIEKESIIHARMKFHQGIKHPFLNKLKELNLYRNKHIPQEYFQSSIEQRLQLIAGLLDTDGTKVVKKHEYYSFSNKNYLIAHGLKELALSCGLMATFKQRGIYYYVTISGNDLGIIPIRIKRKKSNYKTHKNVLKSRLKITPLGVGEYAGIAIDGDHLFIIENNIVTHNTSKQAEADWILGIGTVHDEGLKYVRFLHLSKNKLTGDEDSDPALRHGRMDVLIQPEIARYRDFK